VQEPWEWQRGRRGSFWRGLVLPVVPFVLTSLITVVLTLLVQAVIPFPNHAPHPHAHLSHSLSPSPPAVVHTGTDTNTDAGVCPSPAALPPSGRGTPALVRAVAPFSSLSPLPGEAAGGNPHPPAVLDLRAELRRLWSAYYLARAAIQLADAEASLRVNDLEETERVLVTVGISLDLAYQQSSEQDKGPISEFRMRVGTMREDLYIRPENMDDRFRRLRQSMLSLVDENRSYQ
jgi:hypothetical protein